MTEIIDTFYAIDFDRCLGNFDANVALLNEIVGEMSKLNSKMFQQANNEVTASGRSFQIMQFFRENDPKLDLDVVQKMFIQRAHTKPGSLLEPGARELIDYFRAQDYHYCIMSFGDKKWQTTKIVAAELYNIPILIVAHERKSHIIAGWWDENSGYFVIPGECFPSKIPRMAREVVLIDDKPNAFRHLLSGARGYLVCNEKSVYATSFDEFSSRIQQVKSLNEIIEHENRIKRAKK